jgi:glycosyltransferase involved in cell wall biosynthesis
MLSGPRCYLLDHRGSITAILVRPRAQRLFNLPGHVTVGGAQAPLPASASVTFLIPVRNEQRTIEEVLERVDALPLEKQIIVIDDGSSDGTPAVLERWVDRHASFVCIRQPPLGKGAAIRAGIPLIEGDVAVIQDADMEYDPADVPALIEPIMRGAADAVYGSRLSGGRTQRAYLFWHLVANRALALLTNVLYNTTLSDIETGYKAFRADVLRSFDLREDGFGIEAELTAKLFKRRLRVYETPVAYYGRTAAEGKKIRWEDGVRAVWVLLAERVRRSR